MAPAQLQTDLKATCGYAVARTGFSLTTQMGPADLGTTFYYDADKAYVGPGVSLFACRAMTGMRRHAK